MGQTNPDLMKNGLVEVNRLAIRLGLDEETRDRAADYYRDVVASDADELYGHGVTTVTAACMLLASRNTSDPRTAVEIAEHTPDHIEAKTILRAMKPIRSDLDLGLLIADPHEYVDRIADNVDASPDDRAFAHDVVAAVGDEGLTSGRQANVVAGAALYIAGWIDDGETRYNQEHIAAAANVSTLAIRHNYKDFVPIVEDSDRVDSDGSRGRDTAAR